MNMVQFVRLLEALPSELGATAADLEPEGVEEEVEEGSNKSLSVLT